MLPEHSPACFSQHLRFCPRFLCLARDMLQADLMGGIPAQASKVEESFFLPKTPVSQAKPIML